MKLGRVCLNEEFFYQSAIVDELNGATAGFVEDLMWIDAKLGVERGGKVFWSINVFGRVVAF